MSSQAPTFWRLSRKTWVPWLTLAVGLVLTALAALAVWRSESAFERERFQNAIESASDRIQGRLALYDAALSGGAAFFTTLPHVSAQEFHAYAQRLQLRARYPGIQGIGWSERLSGDATGEHDVTRIQYLEPQDLRNRAAIGYDMYSEATRRAAMARARDSAAPALSGKVTLRQEIYAEKQPGFLLYVPVYHGPSSTVAERRANLVGYVYAPFRAGDLFDGIFGSERVPRVNFRVYDGPAAADSALLHASDPAASHSKLTAVRRFVLAGGSWTVVFGSEPSLERPVRFPYVPMTAGIGFLFSFLLFALVTRLERSRQEAEEANRAKARFLANMSHELRTPLNAIGGYIDLIEAGVYGAVTEGQAAAHERIKIAGAHLLRLIDDVLTYARLEAGRTRYQVQAVRVADALDRAEALILPQAAAGELAYRRISHAACLATLAVRADPDKLQQILLNLLSNAVKFTPAGGEVRVLVAERADRVELAVQDTGIGIEPERIQALFAPFVQLDGALTRARHGAGLGLAISRELARGMGGDITAESAPGAGSTFHVVLPRASDAPVPTEEPVAV